VELVGVVVVVMVAGAGDRLWPLDEVGKSDERR